MRIAGQKDARQGSFEALLLGHGSEAPLDADRGSPAIVGVVAGGHLVEKTAPRYLRDCRDQEVQSEDEEAERASVEGHAESGHRSGQNHRGETVGLSLLLQHS